MNKHLIILGGGIKGTATAAVASHFDDLDVTLIERDAIGSGTTSTNHGRLHLGTAGWEYESSQLMRRRCLASKLIQSLPNTLVTDNEGLYFFEDKDTFKKFQQVARHEEIPFNFASFDNIENVAPWVKTSKFKHVLRLPEHAFNPARLAGRFAQTCIDLGGNVLIGQGVQALERKSDKLKLTLDSGDVVSADCVINTMSRWTSTIKVPELAPILDIAWFRWRLLCLHSALIEDLPKLQEVIMIIDNESRMPSAIPHKGWITLDFKSTPVEQVYSAEANHTENWRLYDASDKNDHLNYSVVSEEFEPIKLLSQSVIKDNLYSLAGVHGRRINAPTGSQNHIDVSSKFPDYFVAFGGQASTGFLDAIDSVKFLRSYYGLVQHSNESLVNAIIDNLSELPIKGYIPMYWER